MNGIFIPGQNIYNLRKFPELSPLTKNNLKFVTETNSDRGPQLWNLIPDNVRSEPALELFKKKIRKQKCESCPSRMCRTYSISIEWNFLLKKGREVLENMPSFCGGRFLEGMTIYVSSYNKKNIEHLG